MRISIRHLLFTAPLFLFLAYVVEFLAFSPLRSYTYHFGISGVRHTQAWVETSLRHGGYEGIIVSDETLNDWMAHRLPATHPAAAALSTPPKLDAWGNPYRIRRRETPQSETLIYSTGQDGVSRTDGDDPDDIRSWDERPGMWYRQRYNVWEATFCFGVSAILTVFVLWASSDWTNHRSVHPRTRTPEALQDR